MLTLAKSLALFALLVATPAAFAQQGQVQHVHDPVIAKEGDSFWLFSTGGRIPCRTSS